MVVGKCALRPEALEQLSKWKYIPTQLTPLDTFLTKQLFARLVRFVPMWVAPNVLTALGLALCALAATVLSVDEPPAAAFVVAAACVFAYTGLDAMDGLQARRTGAGSPLGQLFDHGCDSVASVFLTFVSTTVCCCDFHESLALHLVVQGGFHLTQWEEFHIRKLRTGVDWIGVVDGQVILSCYLLVRARYGEAVILEPFIAALPWLNARIVMISGLCLMTATVTPMVCRNVARVGNPGAWEQLTPWAAQIVCSACFLFHPHVVCPKLLMLGVALVFAYLSTWMIICSMTRMRFPIHDGLMLVWPLVPLFGATAWYLPAAYHGVVYGAYVVFVATRYCASVALVVTEICRHLGIEAFSIKPRKE